MSFTAAILLATAQGGPLTLAEGKAIMKAERDALQFLRKAEADVAKTSKGNAVGTDALVLWALLRQEGKPERDPAFVRLFKRVMDRPLERTYDVALRAKVLEEIDRVRHQIEIWKCARFLLDGQCRNGRWGYGKPTTYPDAPPALSLKRVVSKAKGDGRGFIQPRLSKPKVRRRLPVMQKRQIEEPGDNSNSHYAMLGLRACKDAGIILPKDALSRAMKAWRSSQNEDGGWGYAVGDASTGSMTAAGVGSLCILDWMLDNDGGRKTPWKKDPNVRRGLQWLDRNFTVKKIPGGGGDHFYYLYALERAGMLYGEEKIGEHEWYPEMARSLLRNRKADGSWGGVIETSFSLIAIYRARTSLFGPGPRGR